MGAGIPFDLRQCRLAVAAPLRIVSPYACSIASQDRKNDKAWSFADVVGIRFEGNTQNADALSSDTSGKGRLYAPCHIDFALITDVLHGFNNRYGCRVL